MEVYFILVEPAVPENIGAVARAIKTMSFNKLRLVNPCDYLSNEALKFAHGSKDILTSAKVFKSLREAIQDIDFIIGTSARIRRIKHDYFPIEQILGLIEKKENNVNSIGIIFGREESGLTNKEVEQCNILSYIPIANKYPSLNLSQAVMIYAYELSKLNLNKEKKPVNNDNSVEYKVVLRKVADVLTAIRVNSNQILFNRIMERINIMGKDDINLVYSVCNFFQDNRLAKTQV